MESKFCHYRHSYDKKVLLYQSLVIEPAAARQEVIAGQHARLCRMVKDDPDFDDVVGGIDRVAGEDNGVVV